MKLRPLGKRLVLKKLQYEEKTSSGIIVPGAAKERPEYAEIVEISDKLKEKEIFNLGDKVIYSQYSGTTVKDGDDEYVVLKDEDVLAIVEE